MLNTRLHRCIAALVLGLTLALAAGCGQKGDLYLPNKSDGKQDLREH